MDNEIISYIERCQRESSSLQRGMNFDLGVGYSVILMSVHPNAPYRDRCEDDGSTVIYEGHDAPRSRTVEDPKAIDQPEITPVGTLTENGKFYHAAVQYKTGGAAPKPVRVYEKIRQGIWSYNGVFHLVDAWREPDGQRWVFKFKLAAVESADSTLAPGLAQRDRRRLIPTSVKVEVWKRDGGKCVVCGATDELHFDHDLPYSLGGTSVRPENVQLLCARHNLAKGAKIL
ncbi:MAG TPA: HNH endonuclease [Bryobacteraceae bacterium]|nr:HNH endonuclease [Bryobacteraceae bacterium]